MQAPHEAGILPALFRAGAREAKTTARRSMISICRLPCIISPPFHPALGQVCEEPARVEPGEITGRMASALTSGLGQALGPGTSRGEGAHTSLRGRLPCPWTLLLVLYLTKHWFLFLCFNLFLSYMSGLRQNSKDPRIKR